MLQKHCARLERSLALHHAVLSPFTAEREKMMEHLVKDLRMDVNHLDSATFLGQEGTPLHYAADQSNIGAARLLLRHGADASIRNRW